jgi:hypothetical protein
VARVALPEITPRLLCALDSAGSRHMLISLESTEDEFSDRQSRGVNVTTRELSIHGGVAEKYIDVICLDGGGHTIFDLMGGEIADGLLDGTRLPAETVRRVLSKWRRFWGQIPQPMLSREEQLGLFAEIWFLVEWLFPNLGHNAIMAWHGPWGSRHDFEWSDKSIEVKATTNIRGRIHKIHGLDQLSNPENGVLFLFSVSLRDEHGATHNLPSLIEECRSHLADFDEGLARLENGLAHLGYSPSFDNEYASLKLRVAESALFRVDADFPRLIPMSFTTGIPSGIEKIDYEINLNSCNHLIVANQPNELPFS